MKRLSHEYLAEQQRAVDVSATPPWTDAPYCKVDPASAANALKRHIEGLAK